MDEPLTSNIRDCSLHTISTFTMHTFLCTFRTINFISLPCLAVVKSYATCQTFTCPHQPPSPYSLPCMLRHKPATQDGLMPYVGNQLSPADVNGRKGEARLRGNHMQPALLPLKQRLHCYPSAWSLDGWMQAMDDWTCCACSPWTPSNMSTDAPTHAYVPNMATYTQTAWATLGTSRQKTRAAEHH